MSEDNNIGIEFMTQSIKCEDSIDCSVYNQTLENNKLIEILANNGKNSDQKFQYISSIINENKTITEKIINNIECDDYHQNVTKENEAQVVSECANNDKSFKCSDCAYETTSRCNLSLHHKRIRLKDKHFV